MLRERAQVWACVSMIAVIPIVAPVAAALHLSPREGYPVLNLEMVRRPTIACSTHSAYTVRPSPAHTPAGKLARTNPMIASRVSANTRGDPMEILIMVAILVLVGLIALAGWTPDTRTGRDWQPRHGWKPSRDCRPLAAQEGNSHDKPSQTTSCPPGRTPSDSPRPTTDAGTD